MLRLQPIKFQSTRSGQICSNYKWFDEDIYEYVGMFQSPRSGQICSNLIIWIILSFLAIWFQSPRSGQICSNNDEDESIEFDL